MVTRKYKAENQKLLPVTLLLLCSTDRETGSQGCQPGYYWVHPIVPCTPVYSKATHPQTNNEDHIKKIKKYITSMKSHKLNTSMPWHIDAECQSKEEFEDIQIKSFQKLDIYVKILLFDQFDLI